MKDTVQKSEKIKSARKICMGKIFTGRVLSLFVAFAGVSMLLIQSSPAYGSTKNKEIPFTQEDRDRLIRLEVKVEEGFKAIDKRFEAIDKRFEAIDKRFEAIDKRFEDMDKRFESIDAQFDRIINLMIGIVLAFAGIVAVTIGFAIWDRRTMVRPFEKKVADIEEEIAKNRSKLHSLISALRKLGEKNREVAEVLRRFNLM